MSLTRTILPAAMQGGQTVVSVEDVCKTFRIPTHRVTTFKERALHPFRMTSYNRFQALEGVSFEVRSGEFFGVFGRNGSGKSTLLKLLASIYRADAGRIRVAGRLAPFIELGVGFNEELTAEENIVLNCVMMGFSVAQAQGRIDDVIEFAELEEFVDMKLKNFSSGMRVRLAFSLLMQSDADILLIDEVLAVGDASFQHKCHKAFQQLREEGRTIVFVTHDMAAAQQYCHRAILLERGRIVHDGTPADTARRYVKLNEEAETPPPEGDLPSRPGAGPPLRVRELWLEDAEGSRTIAVRSGEQLRLRGEVEARRPLESSVFSFEVRSADGVGMFSVLVDPGAGSTGLGAGERLSVRADVENPLAAGGYLVRLWASEGAEDWDPLDSANLASTFEVIGGSERLGIIAPAYSSAVERRPAPDAASAPEAVR
jgi:ABC-type polysaccharide/polyol phosphate transport system ATPase subunit